LSMNMDIGANAFADSGVEKAVNDQWPPQHIAQYDYDAQSGANSLVEMNLDEDNDCELGMAVEEQGLISGDMIDVDAAYQPKNDNKSPQNMKRRVKSSAARGKINQNMVMQQASGLKRHFQSKLSSESKHQMNVHSAPEANMGVCAWCVALFYWIPIRYLAWLGAMALFILPFLDVKFQSGITFVEWLLYWYIQLFALIAIFIESPTWILTRKVQLNLYKYCRLLRRTWGRAFFYIIVSMLTFAELQGGTVMTLSMFAGIYMSALSVLMLMFSVMAAKQYRLMYSYMASGGSEERLIGDEFQGDLHVDADKLYSRVASYFNELDHDRDGKIGANELHSFAEHALRRNLSNAERYTIQLFLDCSCNGYITKQDWCKQFCSYHDVTFL
jgi:hypothetical protein